jgi:YVTN family beta-propeller protein
MTMRNTTIAFRSGLLALCLAVGAVGVARAQYLETVIPVGGTPLDVLWNPTSNKVYTANSQSGTVTVIDGATNQVLATVPVANDPTFLCYNPVLNKVYCTSGDPDWLCVIDGVGDTVIRKIRMRGYPSVMAYDPTMGKLYVLCYDDQMVRVFDGMADTLLAEVPLGSTPAGTLLWNPVSNRMFCPVWSYSDVDTLMVIDCETDEIAERRPAGLGPYSTCWNPVNDLVYVSSRYTLYAFTPMGDSAIDSVSCFAGTVCAVPFLNKLYMASGPGLRVIDCYTHTVLDSVVLSAGIFVCDTAKAKVHATGNPAPVIDARADTLLTTIPMGRSSDAICWNSTNSRVYIADAMDDAVYVIRDTSVGIGERGIATFRQRQASAYVVCGTFVWPGGAAADLLDLCGRVVTELRPGANDLSRLSPGVYITREEGSREHTRVVKFR